MTILRATAAAAIAVVALGQLIFALYAGLFYGRVSSSGDPQAWNKVMPHGYVPGDALGNAVTVAHVLLAVIMMGGGALQLLPALRRRAPRFHRWNGRVYLVSAIAIALGGLYMVWLRGAVGDNIQHVSISINGLLMLLCAALAWRAAVRRRFDEHRRWALRLYLVSGGVWFFRIGLMLWLMIFRRPAGFDPKSFSGPFLTVLAFAQYTVPLLLLEAYLRARTPFAKRMTAALLALCTLLMIGGTAAATLGMWLPRL